MNKSYLIILIAIISIFYAGCGKDEEKANQAPSCKIIVPTNNQEFAIGETVTISVEANDTDGNITEVRFAIDGIGDGSVSSYPYNYEWQTNDISVGEHIIKATSLDNEGLTASDEVTLNIIEGSSEIPIANFSANTVNGHAPLTVTFTDQSANKPANWLWTFGDNSTSTLENPIRTYNKGSYTVTLTVTNNSGSDTKIKTNYIEVSATNTHPTALFTVSPSSGTVNTNFAFDASGSTDDYDPISNLQVRWDFDGDGNWDTDWDTDKTQNYQYSNDGTHTAKLEVKDTEGLINQYTKNITVNVNAHPTALFTVSPSDGLISTIFIFDASSSTDDDLLSDLQVRWDFDGNGSWDTDWDTDKTQNHQYSNENTYTAKLEVKDTEGLTDQYTKSIIVSIGCGGQTSLTYGGQTYEIVEIGSQCWMAENLNYETPDSWWYENSNTNGNNYGRLYTWDAALNACPDGWHLPSDEEWKTMEMALGMSLSQANNTDWRGTDEGGKMKETGTAHWDLPNTGATNSSGFIALPGGFRFSSGSFIYLGTVGFWWSSTDESGMDAWFRSLGYDRGQVRRNYSTKTNGNSVRCIKD